jgi:hypothetical protein
VNSIELEASDILGNGDECWGSVAVGSNTCLMKLVGFLIISTTAAYRGIIALAEIVYKFYIDYFINFRFYVKANKYINYTGLGTASWCKCVKSRGQSCGCCVSCCFNCPFTFPLPKRYNNGAGDYHSWSIRKGPDTFKSPPLSCVCIICTFQQRVSAWLSLCLQINRLFPVLIRAVWVHCHGLLCRRKPVTFHWKQELSLNV